MRKANRRLRLLARRLRGRLLRRVRARRLAPGSRGTGARPPGRQPAPRGADVKARRGTIFDRLGVQLAFGEPAITVYANPKQITDPRERDRRRRGARARPGELYPLLTDRSRGFVYLARKADPEKVEALKRRSFAGIGFQPEERRVYPQRAVASAGRRLRGHREPRPLRARAPAGRELAGKDGLEDDRARPVRAHDRRRQFDPGQRRPRRLPDDRPHDPGAGRARPARDESRDWGAQSASAIVLDPRTGGILALAVAPRLRREHVSDRRRRGPRCATAPSPTPTSPARRSRS